MESKEMTVDKRAFDEVQDKLRARMLPHLRRAYQQIPPMPKPRILDIGCGSGVPTLELARISDGEITGIDIDKAALSRLEEKAKKADLGHKVQVICGSLKNMDFPEASFDILWAEGSIFVIGFTQAIKTWKRFLKSGGYLVVHDAVGNLEHKKRHVALAGYQLMDWFILGKEVWWHTYYEALDKQVRQIRQHHPTDPELLTALDNAEEEIQGYSKHPDRYQSVYLIMRNHDSR
jgi:ubiquinone/menaquinone biosynthesis C-methylase UbiE